jgi:hypothetical protein
LADPLLILIQLGSGSLSTTRACSHLTSTSWGVNSPVPVFCQVCNRVLRFRKSAQNGAATFLPLERAREQTRLKTASPCILHGLGPKSDWKIDWRCTGLWTMARRDFSRTQVVCNSNKTGPKWRGSAVSRCDWLLTKKHQNGCQNIIFWCHVRSSKRFERRFCRNK